MWSWWRDMENYRICTLADIGEIVSGATPRTNDSDNFGGNIAWLTPADLSGYSEKYISHGARNLTEKGYNSCGTRLMPKGAVLFSSRAPIGYVAIADNPICTNQGFKSIIPNESISSEFLYYQLKYLKKTIQDMGSGTTFKEISAKKFSTIKIIVPSLPEQECIVARIEELFSQLDAGVETLKKTKAQLAVYRQAVLKEAFKAANGTVERLDNLCYFITKGTTPPKDRMKSLSGDIPFIKVYNLTFYNSLDFTIDPTYVDFETHSGFLARSIVHPGDVLMNIVGPPMGKVSIVPDTFPEWNINQAIARFRCLERLNNRFLAYYLGYAETVEKMKKKAKATAGQFNLTLEICRELTIKLPNLEKQKKIVDEIDNQLSQCSKIEQTVDTALQQAEAMRQSILKDAFEGRL